MVSTDGPVNLVDARSRLKLLDEFVVVDDGERECRLSIGEFENTARRQWSSVTGEDVSTREADAVGVAGAPARLGRWALVRPLGRGAFCDVWLGVDLRSGAERAIKIVHTGESTDSRDLRNEARVLFRTPVEGVISPLGLYRDLGHDFMVMEYVSGKHLMAACEGRSPQERRRLVEAIMAPLSRVVEQLHLSGFVHGDIKPTNIMLRADGSVVLIDFGFSLRRGHGRSSPESPGFTPAYASPELLAGGQADTPTDWYALGASLYEALYGTPPHAERGVSWLQDRMLGAEPVWSDDETQTVADVRLLLSPDPELRRPSVSQVAPSVGRQRARLVEGLQHLMADGHSVQLVIGGPDTGKTGVLEVLHRRLVESDSVVMVGRLSPGDHVPYRSVEDLRRGLLERVANANGSADIGALAAPDWTRPDVGVALARVTDRELHPNKAIYLLDDAHWGDLDGAAVLAEWVSSSPLACVVLTTSEPDSPFIAEFLRHCRVPASRHFIDSLGFGLADTQHAESRPNVTSAGTDVVESPGGEASMSAASHATLRALSDGQRSFLEYLATAGRPLSEQMTSRIADLVGIDHPLTHAELTRRQMLRCDMVDGRLIVSVHSAALQDSVLSELSDSAVLKMHERLLRLSVELGLGPHAQYAHLKALGRTEEAHDCALRAAEQAHRSNAPLQRLAWLRRALTHCQDSELDELRRKTAGAAMQVGHSDLAGALWSSVEAGAEGGDAVRRQATYAWLLAGDYDRALEASHEELCSLGASPARGGLQLAMSVVPRLVRAMLMSVPQQADSAAEHPDADFLWRVGTGLAFVRSALGLDCVLRSLALYRRGGSASGVGRCLAFLGGSVFLHVPLFRGVATRWLEQASSRSRLHGEETLSASVDLWKGFHEIGFGEFHSANEHLQSTLAASNRLPGLVWEGVIAAGLMAWLLQFEGSFLSLRAFCNEHYQDAVRRGDKYAQHLFVQYLTYVDICWGQSASAMQTARELASVWPAEGYSVLAFYGMYLEVMALLYDGDIPAAAERWERDQASFKKAGLHMIPASRIDNVLLEARIFVRGDQAKSHAARLAKRMRRDIRPDALGYAAWLDVVAGDAPLDKLSGVLAELGMRTLALTAVWYQSPNPDSQAALIRRGVAAPDKWARAFLPMSA